MAFIEIQNIAKSFRSDTGVRHVLDNVNLSVDEGEFVSVVGYTGSGNQLVVTNGGKVFDDLGGIVARLERNVFTAANPAAHIGRPDKSNLIVFDERGTKVLDVQFLNPQAVKITGILRYPGVDPIIISEKYLGIGRSKSPPACRADPEPEFLFN